MAVLLLGGSGFIGRRLAVALAAAGHQLRLPSSRELNLLSPHDAAARYWLDGVAAVVNCAGVLERDVGRMDAVHESGPLWLAARAQAQGVRRWVQLSALGAVPDAPSCFLAGKGRAEAALLASALEVSILKPSLVFGSQGRSSRMLLRLACWPLLCLPDGGQQRVQPVHVRDVCAGLQAMLSAPAQTVAAVGPHAMTFAEYLQQLARWQGRRPPAMLALPVVLSDGLARLGDHIPGCLFNQATLAMLRADSVADPGAFAALLGYLPAAAASLGAENE